MRVFSAEIVAHFVIGYITSIYVTLHMPMKKVFMVLTPSSHFMSAGIAFHAFGVTYSKILDNFSRFYHKILAIDPF